MTTVVDCAGARIGGAKRLLNEFDRYLLGSSEVDLRVIGRDRALTSYWLVRREGAARRPRRSVAMNNVSFLTAGERRTVIVHNALHFLTPAETVALGRRVHPAVHVQAQVVRRALLRADVVIVPAQSMVERITRVVPGARERLTVLHNPVSVPQARRSPPASPRFVCPIVPFSYKMLEERLAIALEAADILAAPPHRINVVIDVTASPDTFRKRAVVSHPRINFVGARTAAQVEDMVLGCSAILFPTELESFGYPLAEGRAMGVPVVGLDTPHNREVAGPALVPYPRQVAHEVAAAMFAALTAAPQADPAPFDPGRYFDCLLQRPHR
ncbi:hypothetical protein CC117_00945 [Parafrankia colletiae]|uniref:Glycosyltransferase n=1 Tax=Parafrankia colletiae TaxID=573497 RepID=A0A1S1RHJ4_9ACTN|nr:glycosyltransferase [Parafrankia colletiae]MCK9903276.1 glycosyltransferase [Frankia sp. Cpl3]OHV46248.1 hypothetical protein CC117_00945 [Parafrankia colletiae]